MDKRASSHERGYNNKWRKARRLFLLSNPLCRYCDESGFVSKATVVDHIEAHRGDQKLFWDQSNWQALCKRCHDSAKQSEEKRGYNIAIGADGWPLDARHPTNEADAVRARKNKNK